MWTYICMYFIYLHKKSMCICIGIHTLSNVCMTMSCIICMKTRLQFANTYKFVCIHIYTYEHICVDHFLKGMFFFFPRTTSLRVSAFSSTLCIGTGHSRRSTFDCLDKGCILVQSYAVFDLLPQLSSWKAYDPRNSPTMPVRMQFKHKSSPSCALFVLPALHLTLLPLLFLATKNRQEKKLLKSPLQVGDEQIAEHRKVLRPSPLHGLGIGRFRLVQSAQSHRL